MKITIVGSNGFIGENLFRKLTNDLVNVTALSSKNGDSIAPDTGLLHSNFSLPQGTEVVVYLAQSPYYSMLPKKIDHVLNVNTVSALKVAERAQAQNVKRFIYASTGNVYEKSFNSLGETSYLRKDNWYAFSKIQAEKGLSLFANDMEVIIARLFGVYGPGQNSKLVPTLTNRILQAQEIYLEKNPNDNKDVGGLRISLCYIDDVIDILQKLILHGGPRYLNIAGQEWVNIRDIADCIADYCDCKVNYKIKNRFRDFDLIANISLLTELFRPTFTRLETGLYHAIKNLTSQQ